MTNKPDQIADQKDKLTKDTFVGQTDDKDIPCSIQVRNAVLFMPNNGVFSSLNGKMPGNCFGKKKWEIIEIM